MKLRSFFLSLLIPFMVMCGKPAGPDVPDVPDEPDTPIVDPETPDPDTLVPQEVKNGDRILVTNPVIEKFITTVKYTERDYTYSAMQRGSEADFLRQETVDEEGMPVSRLLISPGTADISPSYSVRWPKDTQSAEYTIALSEGEWNASYTVDPNPESGTSFGYCLINNLRPNAKYHFEVKNGSQLITSGDFETYGSLHQLTFKPGNSTGVRNVRDLGGWKTKNGLKTVKYRKIYRGGRPDHISRTGIQEAKREGIRAELDLRGTSDHLSATPFEDADFLSPIIEEGYTQMLRDDKEKTRQCMQFIMDKIAEGKPVYFHCSLGRDRTGTISMLTLGVLGVDEGEISKEYELTQFAPYGYSVSSGESTRMTRMVDYKGAANFIWSNYAKDGSFADGVQAYLLEIGISQKDIDDFRKNMLTD